MATATHSVITHLPYRKVRMHPDFVLVSIPLRRTTTQGLTAVLVSIPLRRTTTQGLTAARRVNCC
ncbi:MAG: hypothetical protein HC800_11725 [Phormidesmis sp. RL_2_1]|nr:hypothetical protein [Phormidesmis sp. RL_2_1]